MNSRSFNPPKNQTWSELSEFKIMEWLFWLRNIMVLVQFTAIVVVVSYMGIPLPLWPIGLAPLLLLGFNLLVYWRLETGRSAPELEISLHLFFDMLVFTYLLYWTGGSVNPFVSAYLVPVALAATFGSFRHALMLGFISVLMYSILMVWNVPLPPMNGRFGGDFSLHIFGMWLNFLMSAAITIAFVSSLANLARKREMALNQAEQKNLNDQHMVALGALAAGAAHELGTPLSNISMLADELIDQQNSPEQITSFSESLKLQIDLCKSQISLLRDQANLAQTPLAMATEVDRFIPVVLDRFKAMRSEMQITVKHADELNGRLVADPALSQTLLNLLNNAADASFNNDRDSIEVCYETRGDHLRLIIDDFGTGISKEQQSMVGSQPFSSKDSGLGIGLLLSQANISRIGGSLSLFNRIDEGAIGVRTEIHIPLVETN